MKKAYIVICDSQAIVGVFSSKSKAIAVTNKYNKSCILENLDYDFYTWGVWDIQ